jgi:hypothetical protein
MMEFSILETEKVWKGHLCRLMLVSFCRPVRQYLPERRPPFNHKTYMKSRLLVGLLGFGVRKIVLFIACHYANNAIRCILGDAARVKTCWPITLVCNSVITSAVDSQHFGILHGVQCRQLVNGGKNGTVLHRTLV